MKTFKNAEEAMYLAERDQTYIGKLCPFHVRMSTRTLCGSWCPHFFTHENDVYITCSGQEVLVGVISSRQLSTGNAVKE